MPTVYDYYKYSVLSTAAYVRMGSKPLDGNSFATAPATKEQARIPESLGTALFNPPNNATEKWNILRYFRNDRPSFMDPIAAQDKSGLGAILFQQGAAGEKVLAITGTESATGGEIVSDVLSADLKSIGSDTISIKQSIPGGPGRQLGA